MSIESSEAIWGNSGYYWNVALWFGDFWLGYVYPSCFESRSCRGCFESRRSRNRVNLATSNLRYYNTPKRKGNGNFPLTSWPAGAIMSLRLS